MLTGQDDPDPMFFHPPGYGTSMATPSRFSIILVLVTILTFSAAFAGCTSSQSPAPQGAGTAAPAAGPGAITIKSFAFSPQEMTVKQGTTVTWTNQDGVAHTIVSDAGAPEAISSGPVSQGGSFSFTFTKPGTYPYHCSIHPSMTGSVIVTS
jgi:plastocyanin